MRDFGATIADELLAALFRRFALPMFGRGNCARGWHICSLNDPPPMSPKMFSIVDQNPRPLTGGATRIHGTDQSAPNTRKLIMKRLDDFRMHIGRQELVPIMIGGMGVDISSADLALEAARLGGVGHISDAMIKTVTDRRYQTKYVKAKQALYKYNVDSEDKSAVKFNLGHLAEATQLHVEATMSRKMAGDWYSSTAWKS